jgi:hypothetical protein
MLLSAFLAALNGDACPLMKLQLPPAVALDPD